MSSAMTSAATEHPVTLHRPSATAPNTAAIGALAGGLCWPLRTANA
ncbi:MAG: hypothetical protein R3E56_21030 [Burkholderiaceae bacterium]